MLHGQTRSSRALGKTDQTACKPGSVPPLRARRSFLWTVPRGTVLATNPDPSDQRRSCRPGEPGRRGIPIRSCSWRGLPCGLCYQRPGGLLPHPFTLPSRERKEVCFLWRYPWGRPRRALPAAMSSWSPDFPRAPKSPRPPGRLIRGHRWAVAAAPSICATATAPWEGPPRSSHQACGSAPRTAPPNGSPAARRGGWRG